MNCRTIYIVFSLLSRLLAHDHAHLPSDLNPVLLIESFLAQALNHVGYRILSAMLFFVCDNARECSQVRFDFRQRPLMRQQQPVFRDFDLDARRVVHIARRFRSWTPEEEGPLK